MNVFKKMMAGFQRSEVIFSAYMINKRGSEFNWKTQLESLCENHCVKVRAQRWDILYELARVNMMINAVVKSGAEVPDTLLSRLEYLDYATNSGTHIVSSAFDITISVNPSELSEKKIAPGTLDQLKTEAVQILEKSNPLYLSLGTK
jgi:hypothetical protein